MIEPPISSHPPPADAGEGGWSDAVAGGPADAPVEMLHVDVAGFEGPLDLLLALARTHKLDLTAISVLELVDQYLAYIDRSDALRLEIAGDFLVMAAWLTYLKSRLLLPKEKSTDGEPSGEELAGRLAFRLMRLEAMRTASAALLTRRRLGRDVFGRGMPEGTRSIRTTIYTATVYDLLKAYSDQRLRTIKRVHVVKARTVWSIKEARNRLERAIGEGMGASQWVQLDLFMDQYVASAEVRRSVIASGFGASLELAREGVIELQQDAPFAALFLRRRRTSEPGATVTPAQAARPHE